MDKKIYLGERTLVRNNPTAKSYTVVLPAKVKEIWDLEYGSKVEVYHNEVNNSLILKPIEADEDEKEEPNN